MADPAFRRAGFDTPYAYEKARHQANDYARGAEGSYNKDVPRNAADFGAYYRAFVSPATGNAAYGARHGNAGGNQYMRHYLVNVLGVMTAAEFREKYGKGK